MARRNEPVTPALLHWCGGDVCLLSIGVVVAEDDEPVAIGPPAVTW
jgi:hypothetical protein